MALNHAQKLWCEYRARGMTKEAAAIAAGYAAPAAVTGWRLEHNEETMAEVERLRTESTEVTVLPKEAVVPPPKPKRPPMELEEATDILGELSRSRTTAPAARVQALKLIGLWKKWEDAGPKVGLIINLGAQEEAL
jgi:hypothetical protein